MPTPMEDAQEGARLIAKAEKMLATADAILRPLARTLMLAGDVETLETIGNMLPIQPYGWLFGYGAHEIRQGNIPPGLRPPLTATCPVPSRVVWSDRIIDAQKKRNAHLSPRDMASIGTVVRSSHSAGYGPDDPGTNWFDVEWSYQRSPDAKAEISKEKNIPHFNLSAVP